MLLKLSDKIESDIYAHHPEYIQVKYIKEFIKRLKEETIYDKCTGIGWIKVGTIDKLSGDLK